MYVLGAGINPAPSDQKLEARHMLLEVVDSFMTECYAQPTEFKSIRNSNDRANEIRLITQRATSPPFGGHRSVL